MPDTASTAPSFAPTRATAPGAPGALPHAAVPRASRRVTGGLALAACALALAGCTAHMDMTLSASGTYDVTLDMRDTTGTVLTESTDCSQYADPTLIGASQGATVSATRVGSADDEGGVGCEVTITGVAIPEAGDSATSSSSPLVVRDGDLYRVRIAGLGAGAEPAGSPSATAEESAQEGAAGEADGATPGDGASASTPADDAEGGSLSSVVDARVSITFPGAVVDAGGGSVSGTTVTWTDADVLSDGVSAAGYAATDEGRSAWDRFGTWVTGGVLVAGVVVGALAWRRHSRR